MMKNIKLSLMVILGFTLATITSCNKEEITESLTDTVTEATKGTLKVNFEHKWGMSNLLDFTLNSELIHPMTNDTLTFTTFKYYVSNFKLKKEDGTYWIHPESYFLVDVSSSSSLELDFSDIPAGLYTDLEFTLGVDSARNVSGAQTGALSNTNGMFWTWNSGYIMLKAEGTSPNSTSNSFAFHLGGFHGENNIVTEKSMSLLTTPLTIVSTKTAIIHLQVNPAKLWHESPSVSVTNTIHMPGTGAKDMATSYFNNGSSFLVTSVE
jgi:hypothetical protein